MILKDIIVDSINNYVSSHGYTTVMTRQELYNLISPNHALNYDSVLPQDYCYNRMNDGIAFKDHVHLFEYLGRNRYRLLGDRYPYTGEIIHKPKQSPEVIVGKWEQGKLIL